MATGRAPTGIGGTDACCWEILEARWEGRSAERDDSVPSTAQARGEITPKAGRV
jgi:hypothetical protein